MQLVLSWRVLARKREREKWRRIGYRPEIIDNNYSTIDGIGVGQTKGKYALPFAVRAQRSGIPFPGVLESLSVEKSSTPLLLSQAIQVKLGFRKISREVQLSWLIMRVNHSKSCVKCKQVYSWSELIILTHTL